jgi:hypothetical protein
MPRRFSSKFATFPAWFAVQPSLSPYVARIARTHARYPAATLSQLRRHPRPKQEPLSRVPRAPRHRIPLTYLTQRERFQRQRSLEVASEARRGRGSLSRLARARGIAPKTVRRASGAFRKKGRRWVATQSDRVQRYLQTYEHGARKSVLVSDSRTATLLSRYANAVYHYLDTGDAGRLREFEGKTYIDARGKVHTIETDPAKLRAAVERSEADFGQFGDLYAEPEDADGLV